MKKFDDCIKCDFDIGYLTQSPCRECDSKDNLPNCSENCQTLNRLQNILK